MNPRYAAAGLASLGRRGDSTLVHMAPREVAALDQLGAKYGKRVTRNPDTGLPEAFGFLDILPFVAGAATSLMGVGPIGAALASGVAAGAKTAIQGGDPGQILTSAGIGGLGSYAGSSILGAGLSAAEGAASLPTAVSESAPAGYIAPPIPPTAVPESITTALPQLGGNSGLERFPGVMGNEMANPLNIIEPNPAEMQAATTTPTNNAPQSFIDRGIAKLGSTWENGIQNIQNIPDKLSAIANYPEEFGQGAFNYIKENPMMGVAAGANLLGVGNYTPPQGVAKEKGPTLRPGFGQSWQPDYKPMPEGYNPALQGPWDYGFTYNPPVVPGPLNIASGGEVKGMAEGGMASIDPVNLDPLSRLSQNIAQNNNANWGNNPQWGVTQPNEQSGGLMRAISAATQPSATSGTTLSPGVVGVPGVPGSGVQIGVGQSSAPQVSQFNDAMIGSTSEGSTGGDVGEASKAGGVVRDGHIHRYFDGGPIQQNLSGFPPDAPGLNMYRNMAEGGGVSTRNTVSEAIRALSGEHPDADGALKNFSDTFGPGALSALKNKYGGGRIRGPGGGLDDLVGGTIEGKQEVRLADGEFVVPADVVSGLGGGSTDKGVYELKNMMSRIRKGATGKTTQINRVNPRKVLPA